MKFRPTQNITMLSILKKGVLLSFTPNSVKHGQIQYNTLERNKDKLDLSRTVDGVIVTTVHPLNRKGLKEALTLLDM